MTTFFMPSKLYSTAPKLAQMEKGLIDYAYNINAGQYDQKHIGASSTANAVPN